MTEPAASNRLTDEALGRSVWLSGLHTPVHRNSYASAGARARHLVISDLLETAGIPPDRLLETIAKAMTTSAGNHIDSWAQAKPAAEVALNVVSPYLARLTLNCETARNDGAREASEAAREHYRDLVRETAEGEFYAGAKAMLSMLRHDGKIGNRVASEALHAFPSYRHAMTHNGHHTGRDQTSSAHAGGRGEHKTSGGTRSHAS